MGFQDATTLFKVGFIMAIATWLIHVIAMATPFWIMVNENYYQGLWTICASTFGSGTACGAITTLPAYYAAVRAMEILAVLAGAGGVVLLLLQMFVESLKTNNTVKVLAKVALAAAALFGLIGVIIFGAKYSAVVSYFHWSFGLTIVGSILYGVVAVLLFCDK